MTLPSGPQTAPSRAVFQHKYCQRGETYREVCNRVAAALTSNDEHYQQFRRIMLDSKFSPGGRILSSVGSTKQVTPYNCFVSGTIGDRLTGPGSIMERASQAARTLQMGGGIGYDFSTLRPRGDAVRSVDGRASGPTSYLEVYNAVGATISSAGERRGAQMGILRIDHPDIEEFIHAKQNTDKLNSFNLSIAVTDAFMEAVLAGDQFPLMFEGRTYRTVDARTLWETVMRSTWDWAEPGVVFIDTINKMNNLKYCEAIAATNPCSEQPLPPFGACLLGSFNLTRYLVPSAGPTPLEGRYQLDLVALALDVSPVVRAMDSVVDVALYPLEEQRECAELTRRMGLGVMGLANALEACGLPYGSPEFVRRTEDVLGLLKNEAYMASAMLALERGAFPCYYRDHYIERPFIQGLAIPVQAAIKEHGIRNSHLISIAPTGTIAFCMDNISPSIEPVFATHSHRTVQMPGGPEEFEVVDYGVAQLGIQPKTADQVSAAEHVAVLAAAQKHTDSAVSKTCNVPSSMSWEAFKDIYMQAWRSGCKGCSTYQSGGKRASIMKVVTDADCAGGACAVA